MRISSFKLKVLLIGIPNEGKTSLFQRFIKNKFQANYKLTVGVDILTKDVEFRAGETATLSIWDIGAQQRFEFIRSTFYKGAAGASLVFDLTREQTYKEVKKLYADIKNFIGPIPFILIGNNIHLINITNTMVIREEARKFTINEGGIYIETSPMKIELLEGAFCELVCRIIDLRTQG